MYSFHLTGSPWFLLLVPPGLWIFWRAHAAGGPPGGRGRLLFALQAAALALLAVSLAGPELRRHDVRFHDPAILVLEDRSGSFRAGAGLGLGGRYEVFRKQLAETYAERKIGTRVAGFAAEAWPSDGFPRPARPPPSRAGDLTSLAAAGDFIDSSAIPNLQAVFLFSDGRAVLDSGRASRAWRVPVYPVVLEPDSIAEAQLVSVTLDEDGIEAKWEAIGKSGGEPLLRILAGNQVLLDRKLPADGPSVSGVRTWRMAWAPPAHAGPLRAVLAPASAADDFDPWNDTVAVAAASARGRVFALKPLRSLDEKGLFDALRLETGGEIAFFAAEETDRLSLSAGDQVWLEADALADSALARWLRSQPGKVVVYARGGPARTSGLPGLSGEWRTLSGAASVRAVGRAAEAFPDEVARLGDLTRASLRVPPAPERGLAAEVREGGFRGMLMGRIGIGGDKRALFLCLPAIWGDLFDPQGDFAMRENIGAYVRAAHVLADRDDGAARAVLPKRAFAGKSFDVPIDMPDGAGEAAFGLAGREFAREWPRPSGARAGWTVKDIGAAPGRYRAWIRAGADTVWRGALEAAPAEALEMARLGFDEEALADLARASGGSVLRPARGEVASVLPQVAAAQTRTVSEVPLRLYNTLPMCLAILALLAASWVLRKKWNLD